MCEQIYLSLAVPNLFDILVKTLIGMREKVNLHDLTNKKPLYMLDKGD